jgi:hypothetical protein
MAVFLMVSHIGGCLDRLARPFLDGKLAVSCVVSNLCSVGAGWGMSSLQFQWATFIISRAMSEIIFEVREDEVGGGFTASALGVGIHSEGETLEELRANVREAVDCYFDETMEAPRIIRLHFVRDEVLAR